MICKHDFVSYTPAAKPGETAALVVTVDGKEATYTVDKDTEITVHGGPDDLSKLEKGDKCAWKVRRGSLLAGFWAFTAAGGK